MSDTYKENFAKWFKEPLETLLKKEHAGFALMMIALPLLERLLRGRTDAEMLNLFPICGTWRW